MAKSTQTHPTSRPLAWFVRVAWLGPAALAALFIAVLGGLLWLMQDHALQKDRSDLVGSVRTARESIAQRLAASRDYLTILAEDLARDPANAAACRQRLRQYMADHPELVNVVFVDREATTRWTVPDDVAGKTVGLPLACPRSQSGHESARRTRRPVYSATHISLQGEPVFDLNVPIVREGDFGGTFVGVYSYDRVLRHMLQREILQEHQVSLVNGDGRVIVGLPTVSDVDERLIETAPLDPPGHHVSLRLARYGAGFWGLGLTLLALLCVGLVIGMAWGMWSLNRHIARRAGAEASLRQARDELAQRVRERTADLEDANAKLQQEMAERERAEERARQHQEQLAHVARVSTMGEMAAGLAHELNQPLGAIATFAEGAVRLIEAGTPDLDDLHGAMDEMSEQAKRAGRIIQRLRQFVSKSVPQKLAGDIRRLTTEVVDLLAMDIRQNQVELRLEVPQRLPAVLVDRIQIQQVLLNLMRNAIEAMGKTDAAARRLRVRAAPPANGMIEVAVSDTGPACPPEVLPKIFDAFYTTKDSGIGMGLSISRSIVEAHGGRLWTTRNADRGLTFRFTLPIAKEQRSESSQDPPRLR